MAGRRARVDRHHCGAGGPDRRDQGFAGDTVLHGPYRAGLASGPGDAPVFRRGAPAHAAGGRGRSRAFLMRARKHSTPLQGLAIV